MKPLPYVLILIGAVLIAAGVYEMTPGQLLRTVMSGQVPQKGKPTITKPDAAGDTLNDSSDPNTIKPGGPASDKTVPLPGGQNHDGSFNV